MRFVWDIHDEGSAVSPRKQRACLIEFSGHKKSSFLSQKPCKSGKVTLPKRRTFGA